MSSADDAPSGLLFTDLEGSTRHLRTLGDSYGEFLDRHHELIRAAVTSERGVEVGSEGDSLAAVFPSPAAAVRAAIAAQQAISDAEWPDGPWRVRMAVHAGSVSTGPSGAVGLALHEAARIRNVAHGGQIVVSETARALAIGGLPADVTFVDLSTHDVRDIEGPVRLWQVGLSSFPPLRTVARHTFLRSRSTFVGRERELVQLRDALSRQRLVTIVGAGGSGKTRLAIELARTAHEFADVHTVELAGLTHEDQVTLAVLEGAGAASLDDLRVVLSRHSLLVVDNCEHVLDAIAPLISELVAACPSLTVLCTSRAPLEISAEQVWRAPTMHPDDAAQLFLARAGSAELSEADRERVRSVCERLDGIPLAIELAAARLRSLPLSELVSRLDDQLKVLVGGARDVPRQRTLRATMDWSYDLLDEDEQTALRWVSTFAGGFTLAAAESVLSGHSALDVLGALDRLVQHSLLQLDRDSGRFRMLEPVRQYAAERLDEVNEGADAAGAHIKWIRQLCTQATVGMFTDQGTWTERLDAELANIGAAATRSVDAGDLETAANIVSSLSFYWSTARKDDGYAWIDRLVPHTAALTPHTRARLLLTAGMVYNDAVHDARAPAWLAEAVDLFREVGSKSGLCGALFWLGRARFQQQGAAGIQAVFQEAERVATEAGVDITRGWSRIWQAILIRGEGDLDAAEAIDLEILEWAESTGVAHVVGAAHAELCAVALMRSDTKTAVAESDAALEIYREVGDRWQLAINLCQRSLIDATIGDFSAAAEHASEAVQLMELIRGGDTAYGLLAAAYVLLLAGQEERAETLASAADRIANLGELAVRIGEYGAPKSTVRVAELLEAARTAIVPEVSALEATALAREWLAEL